VPSTHERRLARAGHRMRGHPAPAYTPPVAAPLPIIKAPMAATDVQRPFHHPGWVYEEKVDGWRVLAYKDNVGVRLISRNGRELTRRFPHLTAAVAGLEPPMLILDGQLISHFEWIRARPKDEPATPPTLIAFDCLYARGTDLRKRPLRARRTVLEELVDGQHLVLPARRLAAAGLEAWAQVLERGYEGLVGKDEASAYVEGRTLSWLKVKVPHYRESERGWEPKT
jgi:bifunctional non-homologous end joining protein LigD